MRTINALYMCLEIYAGWRHKYAHSLVTHTLHLSEISIMLTRRLTTEQPSERTKRERERERGSEMIKRMNK